MSSETIEDILPPDRLRKLYQEKLMTGREIVDHIKPECKKNDINIYQTKINRLRDRYGINTISESERNRRKLGSVSDRQRDLLIGSLLGDGSMQATSSHSARFGESHGKRQEDYLKWKADILSDYHADTPFRTWESEHNGKTFPMCSFTTVSCPQMRPLYDRFYPEPERDKQFPEDLEDDMSGRILAVWYMDDGSISQKYHPRLSFGLDLTSLEHAVSSLRSLGLIPSIHTWSDGTRTLSFPGQERQFFDLIRPHVPECMSRKIPDLSKRKQRDIQSNKLTCQEAKIRKENGQTHKEIAEAFGVSTSTVKRRLKGAGPSTSNMGRPNTKDLSLEIARIQLKSEPVEDWSDMEEQKQSEMVDRIVDVLLRTPFPSPRRTEEDLDAEEKKASFEKLTEKELHLNEKNEIRPDSRFGLDLCRLYFPNRYEARYKTRSSVRKAWEDRDGLKKAVTYQLRYGSPVVPYRVRRALQSNLRCPTLFKPAQARFVADRLAGEGSTIWDPCAGYGGRLLGALSVGCHYIGTDVDHATVRGNRQLAGDLSFADQCAIEQSPAEDMELDQKVDLVFTSPPYFDRETYSDHPNQTCHQYDDLVSWRDGFLQPVFQTAFSSLKKDGHLAWNIDDLNKNNQRIETVPLVDLTIETAQKVGFEHDRTWRMPVRGNAKESEPILVFCPS